MSRFYKFMWWNIGVNFCELGRRLLGPRWADTAGCRVHGGIVAPYGDVPDAWWRIFGWPR